jgi:hypothetical protein
MSQVSRPFQFALLAAVAALAIWLVALKPSSGGSSGGARQSTNTFASGVLAAPGKARAAVAASNGASAAHGGTIATTPSAPAPTATTPAAATPTTKPPSATTPSSAAATPSAAAIGAQQRAPATAPPHSPTAKRLDLVSRALKANKVVALLFYNSAAPDDRAVRDELAAVPLAGGKVVRLAVPIRELGRYPVVTTQVPVNSSPTLVIINPHQQATTIVGFADGFEIAQRIADAVSIV